MRREHTDRAQVRVPLDVLERALRKARIEYVRLAQLQGTDPGEEGESWAEFELNVEPHEGGPIRVFFPADDESRRVEHRGSTPRSSLPRSSAHAGAVHHTVMVTFDINVQGRRRVLERKARTLGGRGRRGIPPVAPRAPGPDDLGRAAETALTITLRVRLGGRKHCRQIRGLQPRHVLTAEGLDAGGTLLHSCGLRKAGAFFPVARSGRKSPSGVVQEEPDMSENGREQAEMTDWQQIGDDSGQLALVDPQYADVVAGHVMDTPLIFESVANDIGVPIAVVLSSGLGDGAYPVEARFEEVAGTVRVAEVRIRFLPHPVLGYELFR
jgi:hypothetical protein